MMFRVYYGDGTIFAGDNPEDAPTQNVQCIAWNDPIRGVANTGRIVLHDYDLYIYSDKTGWMATNKYADLVRHVQDGGVRTVLEGKWIDRESFKRIKDQAWSDLPLVVKSATESVEDGVE